MTYVIGVDTGGTFTDTVIVSEDGTRYTGKSETTPDDPTTGILDSLRNGAKAVGVDLESLLSTTSILFHGTTLTTNTVLEGTGAEVGLLTTRGHADALAIGRTKTRTEGLTRLEQQHYAGQSKPEPLVPTEHIREIDERTDYKGEQVVDLDEDAVRAAISDLAGEVDALAVSLLWSFENPEHERRVAEIAAEEAPECPCFCSHEVTPKLGEYERTATTVLNASTAPLLEAYVEDLESTLAEHGLDAPFYVMKSTGGAMDPDSVTTEAVSTIMSGPTGGVIGSRFVGREMDEPNLICTDVGGTSFDVGLVIDGELQTRPTLSVNSQTLYQLSVDIESIGSGGGSIAWIDDGGALRVGPRSAGADPGPACYGFGGTEPTVTDADLLLGYLDPDYFLGGRRDLDVEAARDAMRSVAEPLDLSVDEAAAGVFEIVNGAMADLLRQMTVERGHDPRNFSLLSYGGAGPVHASFYGAELGVESIVVPLGDTASVFSAFGIATADVNYVAERSNPDFEPFDPADLTDLYGDLEADVRETLVDRGFEGEPLSLSREAEIRYKGQVHQLSVDVPGGDLTDADVEATIDRWESKYEALYGEGSTYAPVPAELVNQRVTGSVETSNPVLGGSTARSGDALIDHREVYWPEPGARRSTAVYDGERLAPGDAFDGPAVIQLPDTTVTVRPHQHAAVDEYRSVHITEGDR
ncbi:hydantoinase/oxoprolinase family protein [Halovivax cerinus]|uniref:Hydantoinase/oxoprolinase family protein n=1 Tax=Halovivax cerinus TaxID=1487865 RepID=A0ABD5NPJ2_9EURY|nr:hydantoinase/oxoprolinase family protein [Halovivax cerinus]